MVWAFKLESFRHFCLLDPPHLIENPIVGDHRIVLWCPATRTKLRTFLTSTRPSVVKLANSEAACVVHFDGKATSFDLRESENGLKYFRAHSASILSLDMNTVNKLFLAIHLFIQIKMLRKLF